MGAFGGLVYFMSICVHVPVKIGVGSFYHFPTNSAYSKYSP